MSLKQLICHKDRWANMDYCTCNTENIHFINYLDILRTFCHSVFLERYPNVFVHNESYQESSNADNEPRVSNQNFTLSTPCSDLPNEVLQHIETCLNECNEVLENDWKR